MISLFKYVNNLLIFGCILYRNDVLLENIFSAINSRSLIFSFNYNM